MASAGRGASKEVDRVQAERERARVEARREAERDFLEDQREEAREQARKERLGELERENQSLQERVSDRLRGLGSVAQSANDRIPDDAGIDAVDRRDREDDRDTEPLLGGNVGTDEDILDPLGASDGIEAGNIEFFDSTEDGDDEPMRYF